MARRQQSIIASFQDLKREYRSDYAAARPSRFRRVRPGLFGSADSHYANEFGYFKMIEYVRDLERNDPILRPLLHQATVQQIQGGFRYDPKTPDQSLNDELKAWHEEWAQNPIACSLDGRTSFPKGEELAMKATIRDGDVFALPIDTGELQWLECERVKTPKNSRRNIVHGIELDPYRKPIAYYFTKGEVDPWVRIERVSDMMRFAAYDEEGHPQVFHILNEGRVSQTRGVSDFIAAQDMLGVRDDVEFALLIKQQVAAFLVGAWENSTNYPDVAGGTGVGTQRQEQSPTGTDIITLEDIEPGTILHPPKGKTLKIHSSGIQSSESLDHLRRIIQIVGIQVAMPLIMTLMDASETNFSGWRGAVDLARLIFMSNQRNMIRRLHQPVADWRIRWGMGQKNEFGRGLRKAYQRHAKALFRHRWHPPRWPYVQPLTDAQADALKLTTLLSSPRRVAADRGLEFTDIYTETIEDNKAAILAAIKASGDILDETGVSVHYRELLNRDLFHGAQLIDDEDKPNPPQKTTQPGKTKK